jgi:hypothetical protein
MLEGTGDIQYRREMQRLDALPLATEEERTEECFYTPRNGYRAIAFDALSRAAEARQKLRCIAKVQEALLPVGFRAYWLREHKAALGQVRFCQSQIRFAGGLA